MDSNFWSFHLDIRWSSNCDGSHPRLAQTAWLWEQILQAKVRLSLSNKSRRLCDPEKCRLSFEQSNVKLTILYLLGDSNQFRRLTLRHHQARLLSSLFTSSHLFPGYCRLTTIRFQAGTSMTTQWQHPKTYFSSFRNWVLKLMFLLPSWKPATVKE